jgi:hypothetical protein
MSKLIKDIIEAHKASLITALDKAKDDDISDYTEGAIDCCEVLLNKIKTL